MSVLPPYPTSTRSMDSANELWVLDDGRTAVMVEKGMRRVVTPERTTSESAVVSYHCGTQKPKSSNAINTDTPYIHGDDLSKALTLGRTIPARNAKAIHQSIFARCLISDSDSRLPPRGRRGKLGQAASDPQVL